MLIRLTEQHGGVVNPGIVVTKEIVVNTDFIQSIEKISAHYPFKDQYSKILMASGNAYNVQEDFDDICNLMTEKDGSK